VDSLTAILVSGFVMSLIALSGGVVLWLGEDRANRLVLPLVALSSGSLIGGALFHLLPGGVARMGNVPAVYVWVASGFLAFLALEHVLYWHHCHRPAHAHHKPMGFLLLIGDSVHNFIGGLAIGAAFVADVPFAAGNFLYIGAADLIPQFREGRDGKPVMSHIAWWMAGLLMLLGAAMLEAAP
jgi:zinc and cadmium transporter